MLFNTIFQVLSFENVAIVAKFSLKSDPTIKFLVTTTHLYHNPKRQDVRLAQIQLLLAEIDTFSSDRCPVILTGDLNCMPFSAPFELLVQGTLNYENLTQHALTVNYFNDTVNGKKLLPVSVGITDNCQHVNVHTNNVLSKVSRKMDWKHYAFFWGSLL